MRNNCMRIASLLVLIFLLPAFTHAALVNINTADKETLMELVGIGDVLADRIIEYRETKGPFKTIEELTNIERLYPSTFVKIKDDITVGDTETPDPTPPAATSTAATTTTTTAGSSGGGPPEYIPIPTLRVITSGDKTISSGADAAFTTVVYDGRGNKRDDALVMWSFGDGMQRTGASVYHAYYYPGEYVVVVHVSTPDGGDALVERIVTVKDANVKIVSVSARGISLTNNSSRTLDLSLWRLSAGGKEFKIPAGTQILAGRTILFPSQVIQLPIVDSASLLYPSGEIAAVYPTISQMSPVRNQISNGASVRPSAPQTSFNKMQAVRSTIINTATDTQMYEKAVIAPTAATKLAAVGAAVSTTSRVDTPKTGGIFRSPWFLGLFGVIALAGSAFIFL